MNVHLHLWKPSSALLALGLAGCSVAQAQDRSLPVPQTSSEQSLYLHAQHAVARWTNHIQGTGAEVIERLKATRLFAEDVEFRFHLGEPEPAVFQGLDSEGLLQFYSDFFDPMPAPPFYMASNVEALEYEPEALKFRFHHVLFINGQPGLMGDNVAQLRMIDGVPQLTRIEVTVTHFDGAVLTGTP